MKVSGETLTGSADSGRFRGFLKGNQRLFDAFWLAGVFPAVIVALLGLAFVGSPHYVEFLLTHTTLVVATRLYAWVSIFKCRHNTESKAFRYTVMALLIIDVMHKMIVWPVIYTLAISQLLS